MAMVQSIKESGSKYLEKRKKEDPLEESSEEEEEEDGHEESKREELLKKTLKEYYSSLPSDKTGRPIISMYMMIVNLKTQLF